MWPEMVEALDLPVKEEQVRRWLHRNSVPVLSKRGAQPGEKNCAWKGGRIVDKHGYIVIRKPDHPYANSAGYVREHRLVMEAEIGPCLEPEEVVHHINGDKSDNRPENLQLFSSNAEHLAETLKGQVPNWSEEGEQRVYEGLEKGRQRSAEMRQAEN